MGKRFVGTIILFLGLWMLYEAAGWAAVAGGILILWGNNLEQAKE